MRPISELIIHCTATRPEWWAGRSLAQKTAEVRLWHTRDRGWRDIGYHYLIDRDGKVGTGRPLDQIGAHTQGRNTGTIGIALFGGHGSAVTDPFGANFTPEQERALIALIADLRGRFPITKVSGHNQYAAKACPGFDVPTWLASQRPAPRPVVTSPQPQTDTNNPLAALLGWLAGIFGGRK
jgi:N-acetylmuramoyl-L-alanine amidase